MLNIIALIVYVSFFNIIYIDKFKNRNVPQIPQMPQMPQIPQMPQMPQIPPPLSNNTAIRSKYCNFKCNCFFSHSVKNDNICVPIWIKPLGL